MANKRGLLSRPKLSMVQARATEFMLLIDAYDKTQDQIFDLKMAIASFDPARLKELFPEWDKDKDDLDDTEGTWKFKPMDPAQAAAQQSRIMDELLANKSGTLSMEQFLAHSGNGHKDNPWI